MKSGTKGCRTGKPEAINGGVVCQELEVGPGDDNYPGASQWWLHSVMHVHKAFECEVLGVVFFRSYT